MAASSYLIPSLPVRLQIPSFPDIIGFGTRLVKAAADMPRIVITG